MTKIEWTDETWNPVTGCTKVSQGCKHCYAERLWPKVAGAEAKRTGEPARDFTDVRCHPERLDAPLHWKKPRRIFVNSMSDLFHEDVPAQFIGAVFTTMARARQHKFQVLTKRPNRMLGIIDGWRKLGLTIREGCGAVLPNVWLGVSVEDQPTADERIPLLIQTPAALRFVSYEPALGPVDLWQIPIPGTHGEMHNLREIDWLIAGGESGPNARPPHPGWFRSVRDQCAAAGVPFFFKQWGEWAPDCYCPTRLPCKTTPRPGAGFPGCMFRCGKKAAGRTLDGRVHDEFPT